MARLEKAVEYIVDVFVDNAGSNGKLNQDGLKKMIEKEIDCAEIKAELNAAGFDTILQDMDRDSDGEVNFKEFTKCVSYLAKCYYFEKTGKRP